jgi:hypothetical protein
MFRIDMTIGIATLISAVVSGGYWGLAIDRKAQANAYAIENVSDRQDRTEAEIQRRLRSIEDKVDKLIERGN